MPVLRASEIGEYVYCHRAWWLHRVRGIQSRYRARLEAGTARHLAHGRSLQYATALRRAALLLLALAAVLAAALAIIIATYFA